MQNICLCQLRPTTCVCSGLIYVEEKKTPETNGTFQSQDTKGWDAWLLTISFWSPSLGPTSTIFTNFGYSCPVGVCRPCEGGGVCGLGKGGQGWEWGERRERDVSQQDAKHTLYVMPLAWSAPGRAVCNMAICLLQRLEETGEMRHAAVIAYGPDIRWCFRKWQIS